MKKIKIVLTFDYELPLGKASNYHKGLFHPADELIRCARKLKVPLVFFADICSAIRFRDWDRKNFYDPFVRQLHGALAEGHDVQLHIHPHWMTSNYTNGGFVPSLDFSLRQFSNGKNGWTIEQLIDLAFENLSSICREAVPDYKCVAFRAGGYDVEPESARILSRLQKLGVRIESSVIKGYYLNYNFSKVDYSGTPSASSWYVSSPHSLVKASDNGLLELPITSKPVSIGDIIGRRIRKTLNRHQYTNRVYQNGGKGFLSVNGKQDLQSMMRKIWNPAVLSLDKEYTEAADLLSIVDYNVHKYASETSDLVLTAIGHPKSMGGYHLGLMETFVNSIREKYGDQVSFVTYREIARSL